MGQLRWMMLALVVVATGGVAVAAAVIGPNTGETSSTPTPTLPAPTSPSTTTTTAVPATTSPPTTTTAVPTSDEILSATVPVRCLVDTVEWLTLTNGQASRIDGPGGVEVTATTTGDLNGDGMVDVIIAVREFCGGESSGPAVIVKGGTSLTDRQSIASLSTPDLLPMGEVLALNVLPEQRLEVIGQTNTLGFVNGLLEQIIEPTPPQQYVLSGGTFTRISPP